MLSLVDVLAKDFKSFFSELLLFRYYLPLEKGVALHLNKFESQPPKNNCAKFGRNWPSGSGEEDEM